MIAEVERDTVTLARRIADLGTGRRTRVFRSSWWSDRVMDWAMERRGFKTQLFRFVDVFPALSGAPEVARHLSEYFDGVDVPKALDVGIDLADRVPLGARVEARIARRNIMRMARQFIVGASADEAVAGLHELWRAGSTFTVDVLGEKTVVGSEADRYAARVEELVVALDDASRHWAPDDHLERDDLGPLHRVNVSVKPTALATHYEPLSREVGLDSAKQRLRPLLRLARERGAFVNVDMEHYDAKDITLQLFRDLLSEDEFADMPAGIVVQAYLRDSREDLADLIAWSARRPQPITVRLVKGAYWDAETVHARAEGWPVPVFEDKADTDANYERCVRLLHDHHGEVRAAFGSHNLRSLAYAITYARRKGIPDTGYEIQMLYGMAEPMHEAIRRLGFRLRVYAPVGELVPGMAYLVRRLLENTSNESFVRHRFAEGRDLDELLASPGPRDLPPPGWAEPRPATDPADPTPYQPEPVSEFRRRPARGAMAAAVRAFATGLGEEVPALIGGERVTAASTLASVDPAEPATVVAEATACTAADVDAAVAIAAEAATDWRRTPTRERAGVLFRAADWMRGHRHEIAALECFEAGKPWDQADADVCEAIDFCEYYGREALRLSTGGEVGQAPGEANSYRYEPRGVGVVISPWNFPLAIPTGMLTAALVTGNAALLKPAEQTPGIALRLVQILHEAGVPPGVLAFLPGAGEEVGAYLVAHPGVSFVAFTGSRAVGLEIVREAAVHREGQRHVKRVIAEMGGKNAVIVDSDADLDVAVPAITASAFGYAGQKCSAASRVIALAPIFDELVDRLAGAAAVVPIGHASELRTTVGPLIDEDAYRRVGDYQDIARNEGKIALQRNDVPAGGWYLGPTVVVTERSDARVATEEIFGPVLTCLRADDFDEALALANASDYALTGGLFSRSPARIRRAARELQAGNLYVNRAITGALVGRQ
ncbi:MAG TPA: proline dehydrogenase family protein, partial [Acidimicrobiales bacterium]|nr:proline dehydrogenase family protein [Acidimicrobiales bacterium]